MWIEIRIQSDDPGASGSSLPAPRSSCSTGVGISAGAGTYPVIQPICQLEHSCPDSNARVGVSANAGTYTAVQPVCQLEYCGNDSSAAPSLPTSSVSGVHAPGSGALRSHANDESKNGAGHQTVILVRACYLPLDRGKVPSILRPLDALKTT